VGIGGLRVQDLVIDRSTSPGSRPGPERRRVMSAQTPYLEVDAIGVVPSLVLFLVMILTALGIVAHAAFI
jgi:hypothetical protein